MRPQLASLFDFFEPLQIEVEVSDAPLTSDAGLLPLRQFDDRIGLTAQFAAGLHDPRDPDRIDHTFPEMVRSRVFGILAGFHRTTASRCGHVPDRSLAGRRVVRRREVECARYSDAADGLFASAA